ncbi:MAG: hypothetical protein IJU23_06820 [Proteobacteria bacterium]|nr:hypothetical protein [Pseudomonadota bacterium]
MKKASIILCATLFVLSAGCSDDNKDNECNLQDTRCEKGVLQVCNGQWTDAPCASPKVCTVINNKAQCADPVEKCTDGAKRCNGESLESCAGGVWTALPCTGKCVEDNGSFTCAEAPGKCTDGAKRCNGESLESCVGGVWTALPCTGKCV